ncbi:S8 family serine peptidase [Nocardioides sp.]|uniref:S8 family serine peptidase n=1 Tax=Nocardioides sp. TaxID=35761 RepID=UPI00286E279D|nr:S8 family serine peptidase [Nocardioides sp.]
MTTHRALTRAARLLLTGVVAVVALTTAPGHAADDGATSLHLVTLTGSGTSSTSSGAGTQAEVAALLARQDAVLASIDSPETTYRWTTALNGFAVELTADQVSALEANGAVESVEANSVRPMAGRITSTGAQAAQLARPRGDTGRGGSGVVIGFVDSGLAPGSPLFADVPGLDSSPADYAGECTTGEGWPASACNRKVVGAGWWVAGFGADRIRSSERLSPLDAVGHGTQVASVAAGNSDVSVRMNGRTMGNFGGVAPRARVAPYKACWAAPDPADDGCATADLVSAIDRATADGVDVLNVAVAGPSSIDTVERALLGAAEADIVVIGAAGNAGRSAVAGHSSPWVTTVGATRGSTLRGQVSVVRGPRLSGASRSRRALGPLRLVLGADVAAAGARPGEARQCRPGSRHASGVADRAVVCVGGGIGRVDKSQAVAQADGVAMVLVNDRPGAVTDDFHSVPTVQLSERDGRRLIGWAGRHRRTVVRIAGIDPARTAARAAGWSASGDSRSTLLKPDVVALGEGVLGAVPGSWALFSGTSAATARVSGLAALLRAEHHWSAPVVRSVLTTTARPLAGAATLTQGAGQVGDLRRPGLALDVRTADYRRALDGLSWRDLNVSSLVMRGGGTATRRVTNLGSRAEYFSAHAVGFARHRVTTTPLALRLAPGETATVRIIVTGPAGPTRLDDGWIVWRGARGSLTRVPVAITR